MPLAIKRYLACLSLVCALMAIYATAISPWLETPQRPTRLTRTSSQPNPSADWWSHLFAADAWQNQRPMMLQTEQGTLLFQSLEELEMGTTEKRGALLRLSPLTLIVPISNDGQTAAVGDPNAAARAYQNSQLAVVVAREGADILFREAPDWTNRSTPPVVGGLLKGSIQIVGIDPHPKPNALQAGQASSTSPTHQAQPNGLGATTSNSTSNSTTGPIVSWSIRTANVRIEGRRVWTTNEVELTSGNSVAVGKDLSIFLKQDLLGPNSSDNGPWGLLGHMELKSVKQVSIQLPPGGLWKDMQIGSPELTAAHAHIPARLTLLCKGVFQFDFVKSIARLSDNVRIEHRFDGETAADEFICHELNAAFDLPEENAVPDPQAIMVGPMRLNVIDALGIDSVGPLPAQSTVQISAPNIATSLTAKRVQAQLDPRKFGQRRFVIDSHNGRSSEGSRQPQVPIAINHLGNQFHAPSLTFAPAPNGEHLGWLLATGPGDVQTAANSTMGPAVARWHSTLQMQPADAIQIVTLDGRAMIEAADRGHLSSDRINITLQSTGQPLTSPVEPGLATPSPNAASPNSMSQLAAQMRIHKVDAEGDVILGNPSQNVRVKKLHLDFLYPNQVAEPSAPAGTTAAALDLNDSSGRPLRQWVGQPSGMPNQTPQPSLSLPLNIGGPSSTATGIGSLASTSGSANASIPVLVLGKELHSQILMASPKPWIDDLIISGPVVISRDGPPTPDSPAWHVAGGHLRLASDANDQFEMQVVGTPARVTFGDGWIEGPVISIDQRTGHVRMDQPGQLCVPASLMSGSNVPGVSTLPPGPNPLGPLSSQQNIEWLEPIKCSWQGSLLFDGHTAHIQGDIEIKGYARTAPDRLLFIGGKCQALEVQLTERVNLGNPGKTAATVQSITLRDHVDIRTVQTDINRRRISLEEIILPELTFEVATNIVRGQGPGEIHSQHQPNGSASNFGQRSNDASLVGSGNALPGKSFNGLAPTAPSNLQGLHLKFRDTMEFRLSDKQLTFMGKVEVGLGPINSLEQMIDLNSMRTLQLDQSLLSGDLLRIYDASDVTRTPTASLSDGSWEFEAMGNVNFESKNDKGDLVGKASRITYFQSKDLLVIRGDGRIPAEIRMRPEVATQFSLAILSIWQGSINTKTFQQGPNQEGEFQLAGGTQLIPPTQPLPDNWKSGSITPVASGAPGTGSGPGALPGGGPARPRDGIQDWFKPGN